MHKVFIYNFNDLINFLTNYSNLTTTQIARASVNISNDFGDSSNQVSFIFTIVLNDGWVYNGLKTFTLNIPSSVFINWENAENFANSYFTFDGSKISGLKEVAYNQDVLVILKSYINDEGNSIKIDEIDSLLPTGDDPITNNIKIVIIPNDVKIIGNNAFGSSSGSENLIVFSNLRWINLPKSISSIGESAFANCTNLQNLCFTDLDFLNIIKNNAFKNCTSFTDIYLNDYLNYLGQVAFDSCTSLVNIHLPQALTSISNPLFNNCQKLKYLVIPMVLKLLKIMHLDSVLHLEYFNTTYNLTYFGTWNIDQNKSLKKLVFINNGTKNQIQFANESLSWSRTRSICNIYIFGLYDQNNKFNAPLRYYNSIGDNNNLRIYTSNETTYNTLNASSGNKDSNKIIFLVDYNNSPNVSVQNLDQLISEIQSTIVDYETLLTFENKSLNDWITLISQFNCILNARWLNSTSILREMEGNLIKSLKITLTLNNSQNIVLNVPLLSSILAQNVQ